MNKLRALSKRLVSAAIVAGVLIAVALGIYMAASMLAESSDKEKKEAEGRYRTDSALEEDLRRQLANSDEAGKRFLVLQEKRRNSNYDGTADVLIEYLKGSKQRYKFEPFTMGRPQKAAPSEKSELKNLTNYDITTRPLQFKITAISDLHVFSFIDDLMADVPGVLRIDGIALKRTMDLTDSVLSQLGNGGRSAGVEATINLTWITVTPKEKAKSSDPKSADAAAAGGQQ